MPADHNCCSAAFARRGLAERLGLSSVQLRVAGTVLERVYPMSVADAIAAGRTPANQGCQTSRTQPDIAPVAPHMAAPGGPPVTPPATPPAPPPTAAPPRHA